MFISLDDFLAALPLPTGPFVTRIDTFCARLTWLALTDLRLLHVREAEPHIACFHLPSERIYLTFPTRRGTRLVYAGVHLNLGDIVVHAQGELFHCSAMASSEWGSIALSPASLKRYGRILVGEELEAPARGEIIRPSPPTWRRLMQLYTEAVRIAETQLSHVAHPEVSRAIEQDLAWTLINCLTTGRPRSLPPTARRHAAIMVRLEQMLSAHSDGWLNVSDICTRLGVSERVLRASGLSIVGTPAPIYLRLNQLERLRRLIGRADRVPAGCADLLHRYGLNDIEEVRSAYRATLATVPCF